MQKRDIRLRLQSSWHLIWVLQFCLPIQSTVPGIWRAVAGEVLSCGQSCQLHLLREFLSQLLQLMMTETQHIIAKQNQCSKPKIVLIPTHTQSLNELDINCQLHETKLSMLNFLHFTSGKYRQEQVGVASLSLSFFCLLTFSPFSTLNTEIHNLHELDFNCQLHEHELSMFNFQHFTSG